MILLEAENRLINHLLQGRKAASSREPISITIADFDGVRYQIVGGKDSIVTVSIGWRCMGDLMKHGGKECIDSVYSGMTASSGKGYDLAVKVDLDAADASAKIKKIALLKRNLLGAPMEKAFDFKLKSPIEIQYRDGESMFLKPEGTDRVYVIFSVAFTDADDIVFAKVFLQEFTDARRRITNAPTVTYSAKDPPGELKGFGIKSKSNVAFVMFLVFKRQMEPKYRETTITLVQSFRDYLHYHIKCSKAYLHTRMRRRVEQLLRILQKAKPEPLVKKDKKTWEGKSFVTRT